MKRKIILIVSLVAGLLAAVLTRVYLSAKEAEVAAEKDALLKRYGTMKVMVFKKDVPAGTVLSDDEIEPRWAPKLGLVGQAVEYDDRLSVMGSKTAVMRQKGEVLFWNDVEGGNPSSHRLSADVKKQMRAMSVNVTGAAAVSGMVKPNDHVDVIGTFNFPNDEGKLKRGDLVTCTILQNVLVLATGKETSKAQQSFGAGSSYSTVTLEVTPREAEVLAFAEQIKGRLVLTLRSRNDTSSEMELPTIDFEKIRGEIEDLNQKRQAQKLGSK